MSQLDLWKRNWDPFREMSLAPSLERVFSDFYSPRMRKDVEKMAMSPTVDVQENNNMYTLRFDLPGVTKYQVKVDLHDNTLTLSGERKEEKKEEDKDKKTYFSEVSYGSFYRSFTFPEGVDAEKSEAKFDNGVLTLTIPKKTSSGRRQISIK